MILWKMGLEASVLDISLSAAKNSHHDIDISPFFKAATAGRLVCCLPGIPGLPAISQHPRPGDCLCSSTCSSENMVTLKKRSGTLLSSSIFSHWLYSLQKFPLLICRWHLSSAFGKAVDLKKYSVILGLGGEGRSKRHLSAIGNRSIQPIFFFFFLEKWA